jgi:Type VI secretion system (T6SS), amidase effector protein 4
MATPRPKFSSMWANFATIYGDGNITTVGNKIGGKVKENIDLGVKDPKLGFTNACALRMSYCLNKSGLLIPRGEWQTVSGDDKNWYIFRVSDLLKYLTKTFGKPDKTIKKPKPDNFKGEQGILLFTVPWSDATGHATLWDGNVCSDHCYFPVSLEASIWHLE